MSGCESVYPPSATGPYSDERGWSGPLRCVLSPYGHDLHLNSGISWHEVTGPEQVQPPDPRDDQPCSEAYREVRDVYAEVETCRVRMEAARLAYDEAVVRLLALRELKQTGRCSCGEFDCEACIENREVTS